MFHGKKEKGRKRRGYGIFCATPIGNLKDITLRALETLREADAIFCEDTRHTVKLLNAYEIKKPLFACHKFNETEAAEKILALSREGKRVAVVSDAGTPVVSDPGNVVCKVLREAGEPFTLIPGASAFVAALVLSALPADKFAFIGFLPDKAGEKRALLEKYKDLDMTLAFHCAPQDVDRDVAAMYETFGDRRAAAVREITKIHEESVGFRLSEGLPGEKRGEYVLIVEGAGEKENPLNALPPREHVLYYMERGMEKKEALKRAAKDRGVSKSELYPFALDL